MPQEFMGRTYNKALTEDEKVFLRTWGQHELIRANEEEHSGSAKEQVPSDVDPGVKSALDPDATLRDNPADEGDDEGDDEADDYDEWTVSELEAEVSKRNNDPENDSVIEVTGTGKGGRVLKEDLIKALRVWDQEHDTE